MTTKEIVDVMERAWGGKTLATLRREAQTQLNGNVFAALREARGRRMLLVMVMTKPGQMALASTALGVAADLPGADWAKTSIAEAFATGAVAGGLVAVAETGPQGRTALALIAADPHSITMMEGVFELPR